MMGYFFQFQAQHKPIWDHSFSTYGDFNEKRSLSVLPFREYKKDQWHEMS